MDICLASDENYASILKVVVISVIESNKQGEKLNFHIFESGMEKETKECLLEFSQIDEVKVYLYDIDKEIAALKSKIINQWAEKNSYVAYARLYMPFLLPNDVKRFLYLDCDTLVVANIKKLFEIDMEENIVAGVKDVLPCIYKNSKGLKEEAYINSGVLLVDNCKWKDNKISEKILSYCQEHSEDAYPDQDAINIILKEQIKILPPQYCVFYPEYLFSPILQKKGYGDSASYYIDKELVMAQKNPIIIHFVDTILGRPWQSNNINPYTDIWMKYFKMTGDTENTIFKEKKLSTNQRIFRILYKILPLSLFGIIYYIRRNWGIKKKIRGIN